MKMTREEQLAYSRGYNRHARWPEHRPPVPDDKVIRELMEAMLAMRDTCDHFRATLLPDDDFGKELESVIDRSDAAMESVARWLKEPPQ